MKTRKAPLRTCIITRECLPKNELIRVVKDNTNKVFVDLSGKANGRGAYLKKDLNVIKKAKTNKQLERHLDIKIDESIYNELENIINK